MPRAGLPYWSQMWITWMISSVCWQTHSVRPAWLSWLCLKPWPKQSCQVRACSSYRAFDVQTIPMIWRQVCSEACVRDNRMATGHGYLATCVCASPSEKRITSTLSRPGSDGHPIQQSRNAFKTYKCNLQTWQDLKWSYSRLVNCTYVGRMQKIRPRIEF